MASVFVTNKEVLSWLYEYDNETDEDVEVLNNVDFLTSFAEGYIVDAVGDWILSSQDERVKSKVKLLIRGISSDLYSSRSLTDEQATHRSARVRYLYQGTFNQLNVLQPPLSTATPIAGNLWEYL